MKRLIGLLANTLLLVTPFSVSAEGSHQMGISAAGVGQPLHQNTVLYVHAKSGETIHINACDAEVANLEVEVFDTYLASNGMYAQWNKLTSLSSSVATVDCASDMTASLAPTALQYTAASDGVYVVRFVDVAGNRTFERWDISVNSSPHDSIDPTRNSGNLFSYTWAFVTEGTTQDQATTTRLYAVAPGGFVNTNYVWVLDLNEFSGHIYDIVANSVGLPSPDSGLSKELSGTGVPIPEYPVYLSYPIEADINPTPTEPPSFVVGGEPTFVGTDGQIGFHPELGERGEITFRPNISGTYAIKIDTNRDGLFADNDMYISGDMTANTEVRAEWDGTDSLGNHLSQGQYNIEVELRIGEYHFVARDVETSGGGSGNGLTILKAVDADTVQGAQVYWDDATFLGGSSTLPNGVLSTEEDGPHRHTWGDFSDDSLGNNAYIDTYVIGEKVSAQIAGQLIDTTAPSFTEGFERTVEVIEDNTAVTTINATGGVPSYRYGIEGIDASLFLLTPSGELAFVTAPGYSSPQDNDGDNHYQIVVTVTDSLDRSSQQNITVSVLSDNRAPVASDISVKVVEDSDGNTIVIHAVDLDGDGLIYSIEAMPTYGILEGDGSTFKYTPNANFHGQDLFTFSAFDGQLNSNTAAVYIDVLADLDGDLDPDITDPDDDGDKVPDAVEGDIDTDGDGIPDSRDLDSDNDGILDQHENGDFNNDGVDDRIQKQAQVTTGLNGNGGSINVIAIMILVLLSISRCPKSIVSILGGALNLRPSI
ncbi:hypothetical protein F0231_14865 [Vibrio sp. RE86]|uniref:Ig-like domain-containing protein n=1 Tax=Vibrio sp. RE86 TaxID=2607605 RepID=UPI00149349A1|nr:Ig-like domain-containing protein [Vibrio sp. RE86]NOH81024.1 hypothetical protein [Vibrio sp. RE86]